ncbi:unnamed protein product [Microthlaspi erraticum]|uniref:Replication protein A 70 kDa DNA-binding subunit B/D first OB fold domain-containing protein n=1 Tax=Microthlaspi erraticum TaxID=1685480 RepID=A0A6D2K745_9BRAS|nr:unnamed protein product [Microthlaspi erraticum]
MSVSFDRIDSLSSERTNWCIVVKVVKTWQAFEDDGLEYFNFLLIDAEGKKIVGTSGNTHFRDTLQRSLSLNDWKCIRNFIVVIDQSEIRLTRIRAKIILIGRTEVTRALDPHVYQPMDLVTFEDVVHGTSQMGETYHVGITRSCVLSKENSPISCTIDGSTTEIWILFVLYTTGESFVDIVSGGFKMMSEEDGSSRSNEIFQ